MTTEILLLIALIMLNAFFAASEIALISLNDNKIKLLAAEGDIKAGKLVKLLSEPSRFLATIQIGITLAGFLASAFAAESFATPLLEFLQKYNLPVSAYILKVAVVLLITLILSYFTLVLGELVPKRVAMKKAESISYMVVEPLLLLLKIASPFVKFLTVSTNFFVRLLGIDPQSVEDDVTEEEIRMLVDVGEEKGTIHKWEKMMINNIFEFNNKTVEEIMTHRIELVGVKADISLTKLLATINKEQFSRIPVYENNLDNIIGMVYIKDLIDLVAKSDLENFKVRDYMRKPFFVPSKKNIDEVFETMRMAKVHLAIVIDEYGGTAGIVTMEDLLEEIVGNIFDEYDSESDLEFKELEAGLYEVNGLISLNELSRVLEMELPTKEYETLNGWLIGVLGEIPPKDSTREVVFKNLQIRILEVTEKKIRKVLISKNLTRETE